MEIYNIGSKVEQSSRQILCIQCPAEYSHMDHRPSLQSPVLNSYSDYTTLYSLVMLRNNQTIGYVCRRHLHLLLFLLLFLCILVYIWYWIGTLVLTLLVYWILLISFRPTWLFIHDSSNAYPWSFISLKKWRRRRRRRRPSRRRDDGKRKTKRKKSWMTWCGWCVYLSCMSLPLCTHEPHLIQFEKF